MMQTGFTIGPTLPVDKTAAIAFLDGYISMVADLRKEHLQMLTHGEDDQQTRKVFHAAQRARVTACYALKLDRVAAA